MAIRVLVKLPRRRIICESLPIRSVPTQKISTFSGHSTHNGASTNAHFSRQIPIAGLLLRYGFPQSQLSDFLRKNQFLMNSSPSDIEKCIGILLSFGLNQSSLLSVLSSCPRTLELGFLRKWQVRFSELGSQNLSPSFVQRAFEQSAKLRTEPDDVERGVQFMRNLGFSDKTISRVLQEVPLEIFKDSSDIGCKIDLLKDAGLKHDKINSVCQLFPGFLAQNLNCRLRPLFGELQDLNFRLGEVRKAVLSSPELLLSAEVGELSLCLDLLDSLKCREPIKKTILRDGPLAACLEVKRRVDCLCRRGLIRRDAFKILFVEPRVIIYGIEDVEKKIDFLQSKLGLCIEHLVEFPDYLGVNLERQIIPRVNVIEQLRTMDGLGFNVGLKHLVRFSRLKFYNHFVKPYPECEKLFARSAGEAEAKSRRHPTGMWKLFKPPKFSDTEEDVKNMKLFVESTV